MKKHSPDFIVLPKVKYLWLHRLFRTKEWKHAKMAEKVINECSKQFAPKVEKAILDCFLYGRGELGGIQLIGEI